MTPEELIIRNQRVLAKAPIFLIKPPYPPTKISESVKIVKELERVAGI